jgi:hypothetical protein
MSNQNYHYRNPDFYAGQTDGCTLLVQLGTVTFSYAVISQTKLLVLEENISLAELIEPSEENRIIFSNYKDQVVGLPQNGFTFVPYGLFKPELVGDFARFLDVKTTEKVFSQPLDDQNQVIYKVKGPIANTIAEKFDVKNTVFPAKGWIKAVAKNNPGSDVLYLNIDNDKVELLNFKDSKLRFYNTFEYKTTDELAYFALFVADELKLHPQSTSLALSGDIAMDDDNSNRLTKFFGKIELSTLKTIDLPAEISSHSVLTLTALSLCGSLEAL